MILFWFWILKCKIPAFLTNYNKARESLCLCGLTRDHWTLSCGTGDCWKLLWLFCTYCSIGLGPRYVKTVKKEAKLKAGCNENSVTVALHSNCLSRKVQPLHCYLVTLKIACAVWCIVKMSPHFLLVSSCTTILVVSSFPQQLSCLWEKKLLDAPLAKTI